MLAPNTKYDYEPMRVLEIKLHVDQQIWSSVNI
jgi:hypothetical protein